MPTTSRARRFARWVRRSRLPLRLVHLLIGSALALSFGSIYLAVGTSVWDREPVLLSRLLVALLVLLPPTLLGLLPQLRQVEGSAAISLLGVDFGHHEPGLTRTWDQRWRTAAWFWSHLIAGAFAGFVVVAGGISVVQLVAAGFGGSAGDHVLGLTWLTVTDGWRDSLLVLLAVAVLLVGVLLLLLSSELLVRLAPMLLGPSVAELLAELESRTTHLVERTRLARELHDSVGHALSVVVLQTAAARRRLDSDREQAVWSLGKVEEVARKALEDLDGVLGLLREEDGATSRQPVHDLGSLGGLLRASSETEHQVTVEAEEAELATLPGVVSREAYRIVQEGVTNALRHAPDQPVHISLARRSNGLHIELANPVPTRQRPGARGGRGLAGIRERVQIFGGDLEVGARDGMWRLDVTLPLPRAEGS